MPSKPKSPYATSFKSAVNRGTPCWTAVQNIATRTKKSPKVIFESLFKCGLVNRQKIAGNWVYWPTEWPGKSNATNTKNCQNMMWQCFVDWCLCSGFCTPDKFSKNTGSQQEFMAYCKKFFSKQFTAGTSSKKSPKKSRKPRRKGVKKSAAGNFKFPSTGKRYRKVA